MKLNLSLRLVRLLVLTMPSVGLYAQTAPISAIKITYPQTRAVFQRGNDNRSTIFLSGNYSQPVDSVQARVEVEVVGQGLPTNWVTIQRNPQGSVFQGSITAGNGWYKLQVQAFSGGKVLATDEVRRIGVGEVFVITGQSNAQGFQDFGALGATEDRVNCLSYDNFATSSLADPPLPAFEQLSGSSLIGPRGQSAWCWGQLGDLIVKQYNVPVLFINTAWSSTTSENWAASAKGQPTAFWFNSVALPRGMPYGNLLVALRYYCSLQGLRSILWQQGESDTYPLRTQQGIYQENVQYIINAIRSDTGRYPSWILARSSFNEGFTSASIIQAQTNIINTYTNNVYPGPFTDNIQVPRPDGVHFSRDGLRQLAQAWYQSMDPIFFSSSFPLLPQAQPAVTVSCNATANAVTLTLPDNFTGYSWRSGQTSRSITVTQPGTYYATMKNSAGNTFLSPTVTVTTPVVPTNPTISTGRNLTAVAETQQQVCTDSSLTLIGNSSPSTAFIWSNGTTARSISVRTAGTYSVQAASLYGCRAASSAAINLTVRPRPSAPVVKQTGVFALEATVPNSTTAQINQFDWRRGNEPIPYYGSVAKVVTNGLYSARARAVFTLGTGNISCPSDYSTQISFVNDQNDVAISVYPNPSASGTVSVETIENLTDAEIIIVTLTGQEVFRASFPLLDQRQVVDLSGIASGQYVVRVTAAGFKGARRVVVLK
jgi:hypothetical protein